MNKISKEKKQQIIAVLAGSVVIFVCLWLLVIQGQRGRMVDKARQISETEDKIDKATKLNKRALEVASELEAEQKKLDTLEEGMASGDLYFWVIMTVNNFRTGHRVDTRTFSKEEIVPAGVLPDFPYKAAKYIIAGTAHYHDFGRFIAEFENEFPYFQIRNIELSPGDTGIADEAEKLGFKMEIVALVKPTAAAAAPAGGK